jgi:hypothetical protein
MKSCTLSRKFWEVDSDALDALVLEWMIRLQKDIDKNGEYVE